MLDGACRLTRHVRIGPNCLILHTQIAVGSEVLVDCIIDQARAIHRDAESKVDVGAGTMTEIAITTASTDGRRRQKMVCSSDTACAEINR
jgi:hypothetical protein